MVYDGVIYYSNLINSCGQDDEEEQENDVEQEDKEEQQDEEEQYCDQ